MDLWCVRLRGGACADQAYAMLSQDERARAGRFRLAELRESFVLSHAVLRALLARACGVAADRVAFAAGPHGKPTLADASSPVRFNLSHSGEIAAYAIALDREVGVDVERIRPVPELAGIAHRYFTQAEERRLMSLPVPSRTEAFFRAWVRAEARGKALGAGLAVDAAGGCAAEGDWSLHGFDPADGYVGAVAFRGRAGAVRQRAIADAAAILNGGAEAL